ncbi:MAG: ABC transporter permease [Chloroflexi bacterium]|nr:ABC transporter permease [Chloroflexota bacterium]
MLAVTIKDLKILLTDRGALVTLFALPLMFIVVMSLILGPMFRGPDDSAIKLPVVVLDTSAQADAILTGLRDLGGLTIETTKTENGATRAMTRADVEKFLREGRRVAALIIPEGFGATLTRGDTANVLVLQDPAQQNLANVVGGAVSGVLRKIEGQAQAARGTDELANLVQSNLPPGANFDAAQFKNEAQQAILKTSRESLITIQTESVAAKEPQNVGVFEQNVPGFSIMFVFFLVSYVAGSILTEKQDGTFRRLLVAPISKPALLAGKLLPNFIVGVAQVTILFAIGHFVFGMKLGNDLFGLALVTLAVALAATGLGILVAALAKSERQIGGLGTLVILTLAALGGSMAPLAVMPDFMQTVAKFTPHAWALMAYQNLIVRGYGWMDVLPQVAVLLGFAAAFYAIALWRFRFDQAM